MEDLIGLFLVIAISFFAGIVAGNKWTITQVAKASDMQAIVEADDRYFMCTEKTPIFEDKKDG